MLSPSRNLLGYNELSTASRLWPDGSIRLANFLAIENVINSQQSFLPQKSFFSGFNLPANRGHRFELRAGEVIEMPPPGKYHGFVCGNISREFLRNYALARQCRLCLHE